VWASAKGLVLVDGWQFAHLVFSAPDGTLFEGRCFEAAAGFRLTGGSLPLSVAAAGFKLLIRFGGPFSLPQYSSLLKSTTRQLVSSQSMLQNGQRTTGAAWLPNMPPQRLHLYPVSAFSAGLSMA
jgi:hypothetical protein